MDSQNSNASTSPDWYYAIGDQRQGPVSIQQMTTLIQSGTIKADTLLWNGGANWVPAVKTPLVSLFAKMQPPPLPVSAPQPPPPPSLPISPSNTSTSASQGDADLRVFVGSKFQYYKAKWGDITDTKKASWNWAAFLLNVGWAAYRKMYVYSFGALGALLVVGAILAFAKAPDWLINSMGIVLAIGFGMFGNFLYKNYAAKKLAEAKAMYTVKNQFDAFVIKTGGTSVVSLAVSYGAYILVMIVVYFIQVTAITSAANDTPTLSNTSVQTSKSSFAKIDIPEFLVDFDKYIGKSVRMHGFIIAMGEEQIILYEALGSANTVYLDISSLSSEDRKTVLRSCGTGCEATVIGTPTEVSYQKGLRVTQISE